MIKPLLLALLFVSVLHQQTIWICQPTDDGGEICFPSL